ncbi:peptidyl-prolyl cis-trans isomerase [Bacillus chungangensis]|uniref:Peptidyl-prolyl cis-trans isomerase n=1 Tax=Bacillus chungangensis TaxID=587633 RepID=A0ABT9WUQ8_9BACI|nr:peptidyl-prolyl cis-trans isomerase [Bacillus chungangensis]MDQ0177021.1 hypothetical protein [Bacillus chungangensis]
MNLISSIRGNVKFPITLDIGSWIFDDRRIDLDTYFHSDQKEAPEEEQTENKLSRFWEREIQESSTNPPTLKTERVYARKQMMTGTFGIPIIPFLQNAEPYEDAKQLILETAQGDIALPITDADKLILAFSKVGKPIKEDGPLHVLYRDGSNKNKPIKDVASFRVE